MTAANRTDDPFDVPSLADDPDVTFGEDEPEPELFYDVPTGTVGASSAQTAENPDEPPKARTTALEDEPEPGTRDERELWRAQQALIEEDAASGLKLEGFSEESVPAVLDALGDDAAEVLPDSPNGTSATGLWSEPEHGGFPERRD